MKKSKTKISIISIIALATLCQCDTVTNEYVSNTSKEFLCFKEGSNWLYQEDSLNITQYFYVSQYSSVMNSKEIDRHKYLDEYIGMTLDSDDGSSNMDVVVNPFSFSISESYQQYYHNDNVFNNAYDGEFNSDSLKDFTVLGTTYKNVRHIVFNVNCEYWIAKNRWIVKKIIRTPTGNWYWSLKKCTIVQ